MTGISRHAHTDALWGPGSMAARAELGPRTYGRPQSPMNGSGRVLGVSKTFESPSRIPSRPTKRSEGGALPGSPHDKAPTIRGALTSSVRCSGWWMRYPCPCGCWARDRGRTAYWCRALADQEWGQWRPPPPGWRCTPPHTATSCKWSSPPPFYKAVKALGEHKLGDMYTADHRVKGQRTLKQRAPARRGIPGLRGWLARHNTVVASLLRVPLPR